MPNVNFLEQWFDFAPYFSKEYTEYRFSKIEQNIMQLQSVSFTPINNKIYIYNLIGNEVFEFNNEQQICSFRLYLKMPSNIVSFTLPTNIIWDQQPSFTETNSLYMLVFEWNPILNKWLGNQMWKTQLTSSTYTSSFSSFISSWNQINEQFEDFMNVMKLRSPITHVYSYITIPTQSDSSESLNSQNSNSYINPNNSDSSDSSNNSQSSYSSNQSQSSEDSNSSNNSSDSQNSDSSDNSSSIGGDSEGGGTNSGGGTSNSSSSSDFEQLKFFVAKEVVRQYRNSVPDTNNANIIETDQVLAYVISRNENWNGQTTTMSDWTEDPSGQQYTATSYEIIKISGPYNTYQQANNAIPQI